MTQAEVDAALLRRAEASYLEMFRTMARLVPDGVIHEADGVVMGMSGSLLPHFNRALLLRPPADPAATFGRVREFYAAFNRRFLVSAEGAAAAAIAPLAAAAGMSELPFEMLLLTPLAGEPPDVAGLRIEAVRDPAALTVYNDTMTAGFGGDPWAQPEVLAGRALLDVPDMVHYIGFMEGTPVATAMRFTSQRIAVVANVSTIPAYRRRGIGEAMTWRAALDGRELGCVASYLQASEMGFPIYQRMGYRHVLTHRGWLSPA